MTASRLAQSGDNGGAEAAGEVNTLVDIYSKHERRIYRYCLALLRNPDDAEDATQETFTRAAPFLPKLAGDLSAYLTTVARNICCDVVRARAKRPVPLDNVALPDRAVSPERQSIDWDVVRRMWRQLSPSERLLFAYTFAGYRYEEIASRTGMSRPSVSVGLTRARRRLRDLATAIGALGALPLALRRLLNRASRRVSNAVAAGQQVAVSIAEQAGSIAAGLLAGVVTLGAAGTATVAMPPALSVVQHDSGVAAPTRALAAPAARAAPGGADTATTLHGPSGSTPPPTQPAVIRQAAGILPGGNATPNDVQPSSVTTSPDFLRDGTAFLTEDDVAVCPGGNGCPALYQTQDGGATWSQLWQSTYRGGFLLLPPRFPADPTIFVLDASIGGLQSGTASDAAPSPLVPDAVAAAIAPDSTIGRDRVAAVTSTGAVVTYTEGSSAPSTGPSLPAGVTANDLVFTGHDQILVVGSESTGPPLLGQQQAVVVRCNLTATCASPLPVPGETALFPAPSPAEGGPVVLYSMQHAYLSTDGGTSLQRIASGDGRLIEKVAIGAGPTGTRILLSTSDAATQHQTFVSYSDDLGATFTDATGNLTGISKALLARVVSGGELLVGLLTPGLHLALDESSGNGTWKAA